VETGEVEYDRGPANAKAAGLEEDLKETKS
jgi:hypothetical protein